MAVAIITLPLLAAIAIIFRGKRANYALYDSEHGETAESRPVHSELHVLAWMLALLVVAGVLGFVLGVFVYIVAFLRIKAGSKWPGAIVGGLGAVAVLSAFGYFMVLDYPQGLLQLAVEMPWPFD
jgi:hypothetical protein